MNLYFDNASTSFPKPKAVGSEMVRFMEEIGGTYSRSAYPRALQSTAIVERCREELAALINSSGAEHIALCSNATFASNLLLKGLELKDCTVAISPLEHNAVLRPLEYLRKTNGVKYILLPHFSDGKINISQLDEVCRKELSLIIINHHSNVNGVIQPIDAIKQWAGDIPVAVDGSQSIGCGNIDVRESNIDYLFFTGHKSLLGPTGSGGLYFKNCKHIEPLLHGGTSTLSHSADMPKGMPENLEAGTPNMVAITGLLAAINNRVTPCHSRLEFLTMLDRVSQNRNISVHRALNDTDQAELFSITHKEMNISQLAEIIYDRFHIECRSGLHCSPLAHKTLKTLEQGTIRFSLSPYHKPQELEYLQNALLSL